MKVAVVGLGYWGPNLVRNFLATDHVDSVIACDVQKKRLEKIAKRFHGIETTSSYDEVINRPDIDAVVLATPVSTHYPLGIRALEAGKHLLVEKPLTLKSSDAEKLIEKADQNGLQLMVDHTFVYTGAVRKIKEYLTRHEIGDIMYFDSVRINLGLFQHDTNVIWDLAPHDISIMDFLIDKKPLAVMAVGVRHFNGQEDMAYIVVSFPDNLIAHFHVNWISPVKVRKILIGGSKLMVVYDDMEASEKIRMYNRGVDVKGKDSLYETLVQYRTGDMFAPHVDSTEALTLMSGDFVNAIRTRKPPQSDGHAGLNVVRILEAADKSLRMGGVPIQLSSEANDEHVRQMLHKLKGAPTN
jgi:predicted dehydrogenase